MSRSYGVESGFFEQFDPTFFGSIKGGCSQTTVIVVETAAIQSDRGSVEQKTLVHAEV
jgi:xanthine/CO dehydrogenase XdhC/CoxF family maturation factor